MSNAVKQAQKGSNEDKLWRVKSGLEAILKSLRAEYTLKKEKGHSLGLITSLGKSAKESLDWLNDNDIDVDPDAFGSVTDGKNGLCYTCKINPGRFDHLNCEKCAGIQPTQKKNLPLPEIRRRMAKMGGKAKIKATQVKDAEEAFGSKAI